MTYFDSIEFVIYFDMAILTQEEVINLSAHFPIGLLRHSPRNHDFSSHCSLAPMRLLDIFSTVKKRLNIQIPVSSTAAI